MYIRKYRSQDCEEIIKLFYNTVHIINSRDYSDIQLDSWADGNENLSEWNDSFLKHYTAVAIEDGVIVGFGDIDNAGYLDRLYVHMDYQRQGIGSAVCGDLESAYDFEKITTHASITAKPFFIARGYRLVREQQVLRNGVALTNYIMEKSKKKSDAV